LFCRDYGRSDQTTEGCEKRYSGKSDLAGAGGRSAGDENNIFMLQDARNGIRTRHP